MLLQYRTLFALFPIPINNSFSNKGMEVGSRNNDCESAKQTANLPSKGNNGFNNNSNNQFPNFGF